MIRAIITLVALAIGFGVGVYWGVKHPIQAQKLASEEERQFVEKQKLLLERVKVKLDQLASSQWGSGAATRPSTGSVTAGPAPGTRSGFLGSGQTSAGRAPDPEIDELKRESETQLRQADILLQKAGRR